MGTPHPRQAGELLLDPGDFQVGDRLVGREIEDWDIQGTDFTGWEVTGPDEFRYDGDTARLRDFYGTGRFRVVRPGRDQIGPFSFTEPTPSVSPWNGRCGRCGRGTYTGFSSIEHEGGECGE